MAAKARTYWVVWLRRAVQTAFLLLFFALFLGTAERSINRPGAGARLFFQIDPLAALLSWLASHALETGMLLSLATAGLTLIFGRWFCGWICPMGTVHHFFTSLRNARLKQRLASGGYTRWHKAKYYALAAFLGSALADVELAGWLDPFSFFFRSLAVAVYPALNYAITSLFGWVYNADPTLGHLHLTSVTEPVYGFLRGHFLTALQPHYFGNLLFGFLFVTALALNFVRARFWCRYICPLGALLGVVGKNPVVRLIRAADSCDNCSLCLADCQGGADPHSEWKPAECLYCFNCKSGCPSAVLVFRVTAPERSRK